MSNNSANVVVSEGVHTYSAYLPPEAVQYVLGYAYDGVTIIFNKDPSLTVDTVFMKDEQYNEEQEFKLISCAKEWLLKVIDEAGKVE